MNNTGKTLKTLEIGLRKEIVVGDIIAYCRSDMSIRKINDESHQFHYYSDYGIVNWSKTSLMFTLNNAPLGDILQYKDCMLIGNINRDKKLYDYKKTHIFS